MAGRVIAIGEIADQGLLVKTDNRWRSERGEMSSVWERLYLVHDTTPQRPTCLEDKLNFGLQVTA